MESMTEAAETELSCSDEDGNMKKFYIKLLRPPAVKTGFISSSTLKEGETLTAFCEAEGGSPKVDIRYNCNTLPDCYIEIQVDKLSWN